MKHDHCVACGQSENLNHHHLVPRSIGGSDDDSNLITLCGSCHAKAHQVKADWRHSELTSKALQAKKARNESTGYVAYGYQLSSDGVHVKEYPEEQATLYRIESLRQSGMSLRKVADELNQLGIFKRGGEKWNHVNLSLIHISEPTRPY